MTEITTAIQPRNDSSSSGALFSRLKQKAWIKGVPLTGLFELTPRCTLDCEMCYVHLTQNQIMHPELDTGQWLSIMEQACDMGMLFANLTGGECLLYPGFRDLYQYLTGRGVLVTILTNGTLINEEWAVWLAERTPQRVQISVYGSTPEGYRKVTGNGDAFARVDQGIDLLHKYKIPFELAITVSRNLVDDFENILRYCIQKKPNNCMVNSCPFDARPETERAFSDYAPTLDQQVEIFRIQNKIQTEHLSQDNSITPPISQNAKKNPQAIPVGTQCAAGRNSFSITWEGKMLPCSIFDYAGTFPLRDGFSEAWNSLHHACLEYVNAQECRTCNYYTACRFCPAGHYLRMGQGHADPAVCEEAHRMVAEGIRIL
jgi:radical SAM protein with 4Fe4S-binding SPASM domain